MAGTIEDNVTETLATARQEADGYQMGEGTKIRIEAIEQCLLGIARAIDNLAARGSNQPTE